MVLASKGEASDLDKYEEDEDEDEDMIDGASQTQKAKKKNSQIYFRPFNEYKNLKDWHFEIQ